jgi:ABC-type multidrug transport system fused ATPase/permease subunit
MLYRPANYALTQLKLKTETPVSQLFAQTLNGLVTIRAYQKEAIFVNNYNDKMNCNAQVEMSIGGLAQWVTSSADLAASALIIGAGIIALITRAQTQDQTFTDRNAYLFTSAKIALSLFFSCWVANMATKIISIQVVVGDVFSVANKLKQLLNLPMEKESDVQPPANWPSQGNLDIFNLTMKYRPELPPVLKNVSCSIKAREKIGIVGRTGAGGSFVDKYRYIYIHVCLHTFVIIDILYLHQCFEFLDIIESS